jgi:hypothetical protein
MKRPALIWLLIVGLAVGFLLLPAAPSYARPHRHGHGGVFIGVGPGFWWGAPHPYWWGPARPYYWYPPPYYYPPGRIVVEEPQVYVQPPPAPPAAPPAYWYYCPSTEGYYPQVQSCSEPWVRVPPRNP